MKQVTIFFWGYLFAQCLEWLIEHISTLGDENFLIVMFAIMVVTATATAGAITAVTVVAETWNIFDKKEKKDG